MKTAEDARDEKKREASVSSAVFIVSIFCETL